jgi:hypothetical protein
MQRRGAIDLTPRDSVHNHPADPYHPLRMNPVDSTGMTRSVAPDTMEDQVQVVKSDGQIPTPSAATPPVDQPVANSPTT